MTFGVEGCSRIPPLLLKSSELQDFGASGFSRALLRTSGAYRLRPNTQLHLPIRGCGEGMTSGGVSASWRVVMSSRDSLRTVIEGDRSDTTLTCRARRLQVIRGAHLN